jgi:hypothetical protein
VLTVGANDASYQAALANVDLAVAAAIQAAHDGGPTYSLVPGATSVHEGQSIQFTLHTTGIAPGVPVSYSIGGVQAGDITGSLTGTVIIGTDGAAVVTVATTADAATEGPETLTLTVGAAQASVTVDDTSTLPTGGGGGGGGGGGNPVPPNAYTVNATVNETNNVFKNGVDTGSTNFNSTHATDTLEAGGASTLGTLSGFQSVTFDDSADLTMSVATYTSLVNASTFTATGTQTIELTGGLSGVTLNSVLENYVLANVAGNDVTLGAGAQNVTGSSGQDDIVRTGANTSITGTIDLGASDADQLVISTSATDISGAALTGVEQINLDTDVSATMTVAQNASVNTAAGTNTITLVDAGTTTGAAQVESYVLGDAAGNDFALGDGAQNVTGSSGQDDIVRTGANTSIIGTIDLGTSDTDRLVISTTGTDISGATLTGVEEIDLDTDASATMTLDEHGLLNTADGTNTVTLTDAGTFTGNANVESYVLANAAGNVFTLGTGAQNVTGSGSQDDIVHTGSNTSITGNIDLGTGDTDQLVIDVTGVDISGATLTGVEQINLGFDVDATMTIAQHALLNSADGINTITFIDAGPVTGLATVENYVLAAAAGNVLTLGSDGQNVTGQNGFNDTVKTGTQTTITGTINLGTGDTDTLEIVTTGTTITGATLSGVEQINLDSNVNATMLIAQNALVNTATGTNTITLADAGIGTGAAQIESYVLADGAGNDFTLGANAQNVTGSGTQDDIVRTGAMTNITGAIALGAGSDQLVISANNTKIDGATLTGVEQINLDTNVSAQMTLAQHSLVNSALGTNTITLTDGGVITGLAQIESYKLANAVGNDFTLGASGQNVSQNANKNTIVRTGSLSTVTGTIAMGAGSDTVVLSDNVDISAATLTNVENITLTTDVSATITVVENAMIVAGNSAGGTNTLTLANAGTLTGASTVENYVLFNGTNTFTLGATGQNVTGGTGADTVLASGTLTGTLNLGGGTDVLKITGATNVAGATLTSIETVNLQTSTLSMTVAQHAAATTFISGSGGTVSITDSGAIAANDGVANYVLAGSGADTITFAGTDVVRSGQTVSLAGGGSDDVIVNNTSYTTSTYTPLTISNFTAGSGTGADVLTAELGGTHYNGGYVQVSSGTNEAGMANYSIIEVASASSGTVDLTKVAKNKAVENAIANAIGTYPAGNVTTGNYLVIVYSDTTASADAGIYAVQVTGNSSDLAVADLSVECVAKLVGVGADALVAANFS